MFKAFAVHAVADCGIEQLRGCVEGKTGETLKESFDDIHGRYFETECNRQYFTTVKDFSAYPLFDAAGIPLSRLPMMVSFEPYATPPGTETRQDLCREIALRVAKAVFEDLHCDCVVVEDMQRLVSTFGSPGNEWLSGGELTRGGRHP